MPRHAHRQYRSRARLALLQLLEPRTLLSTSYATLVLEAPQPASQIHPVIADPSAIAAAPSSNPDRLPSALDLQVRTVAGGIYLTVAASSTTVMSVGPSGTISLYDGPNLLATIALGSSSRSPLVLPAGTHTLRVAYAGDAAFLSSQTSESVRLAAPTNTPIAPASTIATNAASERIRPARMLSRLNFFTAAGLTVGALPPAPGGIAASHGGAGQPLPTPRFANVSFSITIPRPRFEALRHCYLIIAGMHRLGA